MVGKIEPAAVRVYRRLNEPPEPNLRGDRDVEYSWIVTNIPDGPGRVLDFGCGSSWMCLAAVRRGFAVTCVDLQDSRWYFQHPNIRFTRGDVLELDLPEEYYDLIINCSSIEHVGLTGRYGVTQGHVDGDLKAMRCLMRLLKPGGSMLLTIPVGRDRVIMPYHRVYGRERLPRLLEGWQIEKQEYWLKDANYLWRLAVEPEVLAVEPSEHYYALGLFVIRRA